MSTTFRNFLPQSFDRLHPLRSLPPLRDRLRRGSAPPRGAVRSARWWVKGRRCRPRCRPAAAGSRLPRSQLRPRRSRQPGNAPIRPDPPPSPPHHHPMTRSPPGSLAIRCVANPTDPAVARRQAAGPPSARIHHARQLATTAVRAAHHTTPPTGYAPYRPRVPRPPRPRPPSAGARGLARSLSRPPPIQVGMKGVGRSGWLVFGRCGSGNRVRPGSALRIF